MRYGQTVEWVDKVNSLPCWRCGQVLDVIPAGMSIRDSRASIGIKYIEGDKISVYDRLLVRVSEPHGRIRYSTPRLAKVRRVGV